MPTTKSAPSPLATDNQRDAESLALRLIEEPKVRAAREQARAILLGDPVARTLDGRLGLDRALDQWVLSLVMRIINADPWRPRVVWNVYNPARHWFGHTYQGAAVAIDNPDNTNREIPIDGASAYEIRGRFGSPATQFMAELVTDFDGYAGLGRTLAALTTQQIRTDDAGNFVITVDSNPTGQRRNHLRCEAGRSFIFTRDSMADWRQVPTALAVARMGGPPPPEPRTEADIIDDIAASMQAWVRFWCTFKDDFLGYPSPNKLVGPNGRPGGWGFLAGGRFCLSDDDALVITTADGGANYTGFQVSDPWTISPDPVLRMSSLNKSQAERSADGSYVYVLAASDPGVHNWIDIVGLKEGWMLARWQGVPPSSDAADFIRAVSLVKLDRLNTALPQGTPMIDLDGRRAQIRRRAAEHQLRFAE
jgi:hypothetical protein